MYRYCEYSQWNTNASCCFCANQTHLCHFVLTKFSSCQIYSALSKHVTRLEVQTLISPQDEWREFHKPAINHPNTTYALAPSMPHPQHTYFPTSQPKMPSLSSLQPARNTTLHSARRAPLSQLCGDVIYLHSWPKKMQRYVHISVYSKCCCWCALKQSVISEIVFFLNLFQHTLVLGPGVFFLNVSAV